MKPESTFQCSKCNTQMFARQSEIVLSIGGTGCFLLAFPSEQVTRRGVRKAYLLLPWKSLFRGE